MPIYKYVTIDRLDIITNGLIRFTQPSAFNDPFEAYPFFSKLADDEEINKALQIPRSWDSNKIDQLIDDSLQKALNKQPVAISTRSVKDRRIIITSFEGEKADHYGPPFG